jgi:gluconate 2-dehydrogenase gamma chain
MVTSGFSRRAFLLRAGAGASAAWISAHWPSMLAAATHARQAAQSPTPPKFQFLSPAQASEVEAISARIIPTGDTPGAREAGVVYFIDRALTTFSIEDQKTYQDGLSELQARVRKMFPGVEKFSAVGPEQQDEVLHSFDEHPAPGGRRTRPNSGMQDFLETIRQHTIAGFLIDPDSGSNRDGVGWKVIDREREHTFQPPFGYYDKDYPGWEPMPKNGDKK